MGNGPAGEARPVVLRESSVVLGSLASGALSPNGGEARRSDRLHDDLEVGGLGITHFRFPEAVEGSRETGPRKWPATP